jgi:8-amino-3,8-dideoxy-alpha-D-manno-octulosonate transaminase
MADRLAIEGGTPVRTEPLPLEFPGGHYIDQDEIDAVTKVLKKRSPFRFYGLEHPREAELFEAEFAASCGRGHALGVASGTLALSVALSALGVGPGQEVLVPGYMWVSVISAVVRTGAIPVLVDLDDTFSMDPRDLEKRITKKSTVVMLVHMSGAPGHLDDILSVAQSHDLRTISDCSQANGASFKGEPVGRYGDVATFSFQLNKNMTAGEGGMIVCDDDTLFKRIFACHDLGYARDASGRLAVDDTDCQLWGHGCRMSEITAALCRVQLRKLPVIVEHMHNAKYRIRKELGAIPGLELRRIVDPSGDSSSFLICVYPNRDQCLRFIDALGAEGIRTSEKGITNIPMSDWSLHLYNKNPSLVNRKSNSPDGFPWTHPLNSESVYNYEYGALPVMDDLFSRSSLLAIPSVLDDGDVADIIRAFQKVADHIKLV